MTVVTGKVSSIVTSWDDHTVVRVMNTKGTEIPMTYPRNMTHLQLNEFKRAQDFGLNVGIDLEIEKGTVQQVNIVALYLGDKLPPSLQPI